MEDRTTRVAIFDGLYEITCDGQLYSKRSDKYLKRTIDKDGYAIYTISINSVRYTLKSHRLVASAFIPNPENKPSVNHKNGIRDDNRVENLEWATAKEQSNDPLTYPKLIKACTNRDYHAMGEMINFNRKRTFVYRGGILIGEYGSLKEAATSNRCSYSKASEVANGHKNAVRGLVFSYDYR